MKYTLHSTILLLLFVNQLWSQTENCLENLDNPNNRSITQVVGLDTFYREYILDVPSGYDENVPTPLVINFHGFGDCASDYSKTIGDFYNFTQLANEENIIVVYPQGAYRPEKDDTYWQPGDTGIENIYENDIFFIDELITTIGAEFNINSEMIFACGYSNGGMMAYSLACNRSEVFSAIGIMSGTMLEEECTIEESVPIIKFHGIADGVLPYEGSAWYASVEEVVDYWLDQNNIPLSSLNTSQLNGGKVVLDQYSGGNDNSCLSLYTIYEEYDKPGDHVWFSDEIEGSTPNRLLWNFFVDNCSSLSSTTESIDETISLFPNPVKHKLEISNAANQDYFLFNMNGKLVLKGKLKSSVETVGLELLQSGLYTIRIGAYISKLLKIE